MGLVYRIEADYLCTAKHDEMVVEDLRSAVRSSVFEEWHLWRAGSARELALYHRYLAYMAEHGIAFIERKRQRVAVVPVEQTKQSLRVGR